MPSAGSSGCTSGALRLSESAQQLIEGNPLLVQGESAATVGIVESRKGKAAGVFARVSAASIGSGLTAVLGPEAGAAVAASISEAATAAIGWLEERAMQRVSDTLTAVSDEVARRIEAGEKVRDDFSGGDAGPGVPVFEAVIEAVARSAEDRKCVVIANALVSIAFAPAISIDDALLYVRRIRDSSWRQLVTLQYLQADDRADERRRIASRDEEGNQEGLDEIAPALSAELSELAGTLELIGAGIPGGRIQNPSNVFGGGQVSSQSVARLTPTALGREIARIGDLEHVVREDELDELAASLQAPPGSG